MSDRTGLYFWSEGERLVLFLSGRITANEAYSLYSHVEPWLGEHPGGTVIADLSATDYIDSTMIGTLIRMHKELRRRGGVFALCNLSSRVEDIIRKTKLLGFFRVISDDALRDLEKRAFELVPRRTSESIDSSFVLDMHNDICSAVPELKPQFERLMSVLTDGQSR